MDSFRLRHSSLGDKLSGGPRRAGRWRAAFRGKETGGPGTAETCLDPRRLKFEIQILAIPAVIKDIFMLQDVALGPLSNIRVILVNLANKFRR